MKDLEFYIFEDELWCLFPDGSNQPVTDKDIGLIKSILDRIRECYPDAYKALMECYQKSAQNIPYFQYWISVRNNPSDGQKFPGVSFPSKIERIQSGERFP